MKNRMKGWWAVFGLLLVMGPCLGQESRLGREAMEEDLDRVLLFAEYAHPDIYRFTSAEQTAELVEELKSELPDSLTQPDFMRVVNRLLVSFNDAHTRVSLRAHYKEYWEAGGKFLPLSARVEGDRITVERSYTGTDLAGRRVVAFGEMPAAQVVRAMRAHASRETDELDAFQLSQNFPYYYWLAFGSDLPATLTTGDGKTHRLQGVPKGELDSLKSIGLPPREKISRVSHKQLNDSVAYLRITDFEARPSYYKKAFKEAFAELSESDYLIIDVRGHNGGDARPAGELGRYLTTEPIELFDHSLWKSSPEFRKQFQAIYIPKAVRWFRPLYWSNKHTKAIWSTREVENVRVKYKPLKPYGKGKRFSGEVFLLMDENTFSAGTVLAAMFKDNELGTIVGRPSGNLGSFFADPIMWDKLPNSGIYYQVSASYLVRPNGSTATEPVLPDVATETGDDALSVALKLIDSAEDR